MQAIVLLLFVSIFSIDYLVDIAGVLPSTFTLIPELLSAITLLIVIAYFTKTKILMLDSKYIILFAIFGLHIIFGIIINGYDAGPVVAGIRAYFKYIPFFLLAAVYVFSDTQIWKQLMLLLVLLVFQMPIALFQKFVIYAEYSTGDVVRGSLTTSSFLTIVLVCAISIVFAFYLKNKISLNKLIIIAFILFIPTTINETKSTLILLPIAILIPAIILKSRGESKKSIFKLFTIVGLLFVSFVTIYDLFWGERYGEDGSILDFYTDIYKIEKYLAPGKVIEHKETIGRGDLLVLPAKTLYEKDPVKLITGLGMGSVTDTPVGELEGEFSHFREEGLVQNSFSYLFWEVGILGILLSSIFMLMIFQDAKRLSRGPKLANIIGTGWLGVVPVIAISLFYKDIIPVNSLMYLFWYFSGFVAARSLLEKCSTNKVFGH